MNKIAVICTLLMSCSFSNAFAQDLQGKWHRSCQVADVADSQSHYDVIDVDFSAGVFRSDIKNYVDANCSMPLQYAPNPTASGTYLLGKTFTNSQGRQVTELDTHITQFNGSPFEINQFSVFSIEDNKLYISADNDDVLQAADREELLNLDKYFVANE